MAISVFPWPPVGVTGSEWTHVAPVSRLRSALTGRDQVQASQRKRRVVTLEVSSLARGRMGAGYCEMLKDLLDGGIHAVRLLSSPINWHLDEARRLSDSAQSGLMDWFEAETPLGWRDADEGKIVWYNGNLTIAGDAQESGMFTILPVSGFIPGVTVGRPGDFIRIYSIQNPDQFEVARLLRPAITNASGEVNLRIDRIPTISRGRVVMTGQDEAVFRVDGDLPRAVQPTGADWKYTWNFREVFADEVGGFIERPGTWT